MELLDEPVRDVERIRLPKWGQVRDVDEVVTWQLVDEWGCPVEPVQRYLRDLVAQGRSRGTVRTYAYVLQRWWRFLLCTCQASGCESVGSCWLSVTAFAAAPEPPQKPVGGPRRP